MPLTCCRMKAAMVKNFNKACKAWASIFGLPGVYLRLVRSVKIYYKHVKQLAVKPYPTTSFCCHLLVPLWNPSSQWIVLASCSVKLYPN